MGPLKPKETFISSFFPHQNHWTHATHLRDPNGGSAGESAWGLVLEFPARGFPKVSPLWLHKLYSFSSGHGKSTTKLDSDLFGIGLIVYIKFIGNSKQKEMTKNICINPWATQLARTCQEIRDLFCFLMKKKPVSADHNNMNPK